MKFLVYGVVPKEFDQNTYYVRKGSDGLYDYNSDAFTDEDAVEILKNLIGK